MFIRRRRENFDFFSRELAPYEKYFTFVLVRKGAKPNPFGFPITVAEQVPFTKNHLVSYLEGRKIETRQLFAGNAAHQPAYLGRNFRTAEELVNTDRIMKQTFWFGVYPGLKQEHLDYIVRTIREFIEQKPQAAFSKGASHCQT